MSRRSSDRGFDISTAAAKRAEANRALPEYAAMRAACVAAAIEAYRLGYFHLKSVGGITLVIDRAAAEYEMTVPGVFGAPTFLSSYLDRQEIRLEAQRAVLAEQGAK